jgi:hypothetical protein
MIRATTKAARRIRRTKAGRWVEAIDVARMAAHDTMV